MTNLTNQELINFKDDINEVINYYVSFSQDSNKYKDIKESALTYIQKLNKSGLRKVPIEQGYLTPSQCFMYIADKFSGRRFNHVLGSKVICLMEKYGILISYGEIMSEILGIESKPLGLTEYGISLSKWGIILIKNLLLGFANVAINYKDLIVKVENKDKEGNLDLGTGFCINTHLNANGQRKQFIVTNKHVVEDFAELRILTNDDKVIGYNAIHKDEKRDIAFIEIKDFEFQPPYLILKPKIDILSDVTTIGYPSIPYTKEAYQLYHKGEVNSMVEDYQGNVFFLVSAKTSSGNSGSPVINDEGCVVGMLTQELFNKNDYINKGKPPYFAAMPSSEIIKAFEETTNTPDVTRLQTLE